MNLVEHLWQSTLCVLVAALLALVLRRSPARLRHGLWLFASLKFLVPLSLFVSAGTYIGAWIPVTTPLASLASFAAITPMATPMRSQTTATAMALALVSIWACGVATLAAWRWRQWRALSKLARASTPLVSGREAAALQRVVQRSAQNHAQKPAQGSRPAPTAAGARIELHLCDSAIEPGVFGIRHPKLLWPAGLSDRLSDDELDAIVAHEAHHVVRNDNLTALLHTIVETLFWFHPLPWWIGTRLTSERERACDEEVLHMGIVNRHYAEGIVKVCGFCLRAPVALMAGVGGSNLTRRIERILDGPRPPALTLPARLLLAFVIVIVAGAPMVVGAASAIRSQQDQASQVYRPGDGVTSPTTVRSVNPDYTKAAMTARIQGRVLLDAVVLETGVVGEVTIVESLDKVHGLDAAAVAAMKQWTFEPGTKDGKPVAVRVKVEMTFTIR